MSTTTQPMSWALICHRANGTKIVDMNGVQMTEGFANTMKKPSNAANSVRLAPLRSSQDTFKKFSFRLRDSPQELRLDILEMAVENACSETHFLTHLSRCCFLPSHFLRGPAQAGNCQLRAECWYVVLQSIAFPFATIDDAKEGSTFGIAVQQLEIPRFDGYFDATRTSFDCLRKSLSTSTSTTQNPVLPRLSRPRRLVLRVHSRRIRILTQVLGRVLRAAEITRLCGAHIPLSKLGSAVFGCFALFIECNIGLPPAQGKSRHQRAAKISEEVSALARDVPTIPAGTEHSGRTAENDGAQAELSEGSRSPGVDPQSRGESVAPGRMGENAPPTREGPFAQGVGRLERDDERRGRDGDSSNQARGVRTPEGKMEDPAEGGAAVLEPAGVGASQVAESSQPTAGTVDGVPSDPTATATAPTQVKAEPVKPNPLKVNREALLQSGGGTTTLLASNTAGLIRDRVHLLNPTGPKTSASEVARRLRSGKQSESAITNVPDANIRSRQSYRPLPTAAAQLFVDRMVLGKYDPQGLLEGKKVYEQATLNEVAKGVLRNGTYLAGDADRLVKRVRALLPAAAGPGAAAGKRRTAGK